MGDEHHTSVMAARDFSWKATGSLVADHPLYPGLCLLALREVINSRLFATVRDALGLSYDCSFELSLFNRLEAGWFFCTVSSHPSRIHEAVAAAKGVLQGFSHRPVSAMELGATRRTLLRRHEADLQTNDYWISLLSHLSRGRKDISCVRDISVVLEKLTSRDLQNAYNSLLTNDEQLFTSITTAGPGSSAAASADILVEVT